MPRISDVAAKAGVSVATVSRVLNDSHRVSPEVRDRVQRAIKQLDYRPSGIARSMRSQSAKVVGLIISDIQNPFFTALVRAVEDIAQANGFTLLLCNSDEDPLKERLYMSVLSIERAAGVIIVPTSRECCSLARATHMSVVMVDRRITPQEFDSVVLDNAAGTYAATQHLIQLGHTHIGYIGLPDSVSVGWDRRDGYLAALRDQGIAADPELMFSLGFKEASGHEAAQRLLQRVPRPTALIAANNLLAMGALLAIRDAKLRIPHDISLIAFDDIEWMRLLETPLTAISQPTYHIGAEAARLLFRRIREGQTGPKQMIVLSPQLNIRQSTAEPPTGLRLDK